jgi:hypothetical protein
MTTRAIITSQPDVACEVCERRLLRGEQPDIFLAAGRRRVVCELCAPRAVNEGWRRESDGDSVMLAPMRPRRGRNFFERLRAVAKPADAPEHAGEPRTYEPEPPPYEPQPEPRRAEPQPYDFLGGLEVIEDKPGSSDETALAASLAHAAAATPPQRAIEVFNASEFPRRIAGIARSLGAPGVHVHLPEDAVGEVVAILVAWELCWYRYEVDLDDEAPAARLAAQGTELEELPRGERVGNTHVDELGLLSPSAA